MIRALCLALSLAAVGAVHAQPVDLVVVVDNSGSMRDNDPRGLARSALQRLVADADDDLRVAVVSFDTDVRLDLALTPAARIAPAALADALQGLDYRGRWTDIPAALERALYHLDEAGRTGAAHAVLLLTDGIVDTGDAARDRDRERWMLDGLAAIAQERGVRIFGIAFSDGADFRLIQGLARTTGADYRRVLDAADLPAAFVALRAAVSAPPPAPVADTPVAVPTAQPTAQPMPQPAAVEPAAAGPHDAGGWRAWHGWLLALLVVAGAGYALWRRRRPGSATTGADRFPPGAVLLDRSRATGREVVGLRDAMAVIGRRPAPDPMQVTSVVIEQHTISRKHASIEWRDGEYWLTDHDSANGTFLDGEPVSGRVPLYDGAVLRFDKYEFEFRLSADDKTLVRGDEEGGDATLVRSTTVFRVEPRDDEDADFTDRQS